MQSKLFKSILILNCPHIKDVLNQTLSSIINYYIFLKKHVVSNTTAHYWVKFMLKMLLRKSQTGMQRCHLLWTTSKVRWFVVAERSAASDSGNTGWFIRVRVQIPVMTYTVSMSKALMGMCWIPHAPISILGLPQSVEKVSGADFTKSLGWSQQCNLLWWYWQFVFKGFYCFVKPSPGVFHLCMVKDRESNPHSANSATMSDVECSAATHHKEKHFTYPRAVIQKKQANQM